MKRLCSLLIITALFAGTVFAQARFDQQNESARQRENKPAQNSESRQRNPDSAQRQRDPNSAQNRQRELTTVTLEGTLQLEKGFIALASGDKVYFVPMLQRYAGFVEGIKEGAKVSIEGFLFQNMLHPKKVTVGGKDYDFPAFGPGNMFFGPGQMQNRNNFGPRQNNKNFRQDRRAPSRNHKNNHRGRR